jgi:hypothetical protein
MLTAGMRFAFPPYVLRAQSNRVVVNFLVK